MTTPALFDKGGGPRYNPDGYGCRRQLLVVAPVLPLLLVLLPLLALLAYIRRPR